MNSPYLIIDWAKALSKLYKSPDSTRSPEEIWIATMAHCSSVGEAIRKSDFVELMGSAARAFSWMLSFSMKCVETEDLFFRCENTFCEIVYLKFPDCCGHCTHKPCDCKPKDMDEKKDKAGKYKTLFKEWKKARRTKSIEYTIDDWLFTFEGIYGGRIHLQTLETLGFHFLEEVGEEAMAVRKLIQLRGILPDSVSGIDEATFEHLKDISGIAEEYIKLGEDQADGKPPFTLHSKDKADIYARIVDAKMDFIVELADLFSFFCSILIKLGRVTIDSDKVFPADLDKALISTYGKPDEGLSCPVCGKDSCECTFFSTGTL